MKLIYTGDFDKLKEMDYQEFETYFYKQLSSNISIKIMKNLSCEFHDKEELIILVNNRYITLKDYELLNYEIEYLIQAGLVKKEE